MEAEVHKILRELLRSSDRAFWPHHLTMARLVARALRIGRSALIQTGTFWEIDDRYRLSYLIPILLWPEAVILVVPDPARQALLDTEIPNLQTWLQTEKRIETGDRCPDRPFSGLWVIDPQLWLQQQLAGKIPAAIPTIFDGADDLETWTRQQQTTCIRASDWERLQQHLSEAADRVRELRIKLAQSAFRHPPNPYNCYAISDDDRAILDELQAIVPPSCAVPPWPQFWQTYDRDPVVWVEVDRDAGDFFLCCAPVEIASDLKPVWSRQSVVLVGGALDPETEAPNYRDRVGIEDLTCVKFSPDRHSESIQVYVPDGLPLPNSPQFRDALVRELHTLIRISSPDRGRTPFAPTRPIVILIGDVPLKAQVGTILAAEFGSRVRVETTTLGHNGILVSGWEFWRSHRAELPSPQLLAIATLPIPSLEHPLVAGRVWRYKQQRRDWFRLYLLPTAISQLQRAVAPVRENGGVVALLDSRTTYRSYGDRILAALSPYARINYLDVNWLS